MKRVTLLRLAVLTLALGAGSAGAGPVTSTEATASPTPQHELQPSDADPSAPSAAALAAKILEEAQAGTAADDSPTAKRPAQAASAGASAPRAAASAAESAPRPAKAASQPAASPLRQAAKVAVDWLKDVFPGLRSDGDEADDSPSRLPDAVDWDRTGLPGGAEGAGGLTGSFGGGSYGPGGLGLPPTGPASAEETLRQLLRDAAELIAKLISHPMTWLVIALFAIGGYAIGKFDRRPK